MRNCIRPLASLTAGILAVGLLALTPVSAIQQPLPPNHPPIGLPPDHPPMGSGRPSSPAPLSPVVAADPADVGSIDQIVSAYYDTVSGAAGVERNWGRFRSLFIPEARLIAAQPTGPEQPCVVLTVAQFIEYNAMYFSRGGYIERDVHRVSERFGNAAHVFSTYEARRSESDPRPYSRGINSIQLVHDGTRWWITGVMWDYERDNNAIPAQYLPASAEPDRPSP